ncbi:response regulator transcription factor [Euhalothece natronophila Z-M001]|uniref:Response regulator transcription factor n=1 Tax=Euhalothece natronophila Z-M001 TaxID=522448 RepID=A0A5B8NLK9_9CHRO|nr:response regulator transcription factor [Euhalothece natronophila]QDZ40142.1 response regulator transcription factor [Euhalothece natronophila Z-M001]
MSTQATQQKTLRVLIADDHELTRYSLKLILSTREAITLVGVACNGQEALEMTQEYAPDVLVMDLQMPIMDGLSASKKIKQLHPQAQIIAYSSLEDPQTEALAQTAPIDAFCSKETPTEELVTLIKQLGREVSH